LVYDPPLFYDHFLHVSRTYPSLVHLQPTKLLAPSVVGLLHDLCLLARLGQGLAVRYSHFNLPELKQMVLDYVVSANSKRNYAKALDCLFAFAAGRPLTRALLIEWRATMDKLSPSTVNVRLSAMRKLVTEARLNGLLGAEEAANLTEVPNIRQKGTRLENWLTRDQTKELLLVLTARP